MAAQDDAAAPGRQPDSVHHYGPNPSQYAELYVPSERRLPGVIVIIHGGFWRDTYDASLGHPLAADLVRRGWVVWNLEYRRTTDAEVRGPDTGGWPETFEDVSAGIDALGPVLAEAGLERGHVVVLGHSAGGHLAAWAAGRHKLPAGAPGAEPAVKVDGVVSQAGVLELWMANWLKLSHSAAVKLMEVTSEEDPRRWQLADPVRMLPIGVPVIAVHGKSDADVPSALSRAYTDAARAQGDPARMVFTTGDHQALITPGTPAWDACLVALAELAVPA
ncbi:MULTISPECIES: alpha/beta hydrolase family protein [Micrococcaceae]|uniref:Putative lipase/esterase n=1 Tax=Arthrobacter rhombi TaxID=71253 RepID=A0A1R4ETX9_9MICC|nr:MULTISPECIES: alpha/beta hydrolase [Micrococcaceae]PCC24565.1 alpha/beta hydrolase [Glutamicibacter sp. BW78]SJM47120.1 putative lipase/esterase [Arthrobacter rhombi]